MTTVFSPSLQVAKPEPHEHLGFSAINAVFADRFRVRREKVQLQLNAFEYARISSTRTLSKLARRLKNEFGGTLEISTRKQVSTAGRTCFYIEAHAHPLEP